MKHHTVNFFSGHCKQKVIIFSLILVNFHWQIHLIVFGQFVCAAFSKQSQNSYRMS